MKTTANGRQSQNIKSGISTTEWILTYDSLGEIRGNLKCGCAQSNLFNYFPASCLPTHSDT